MPGAETKTRREDSIGESRGAYVFAQGLELVLGEVLALLDLGDPQIQIHRGAAAAN